MIRAGVTAAAGAAVRRDGRCGASIVRRRGHRRLLPTPPSARPSADVTPLERLAVPVPLLSDLVTFQGLPNLPSHP
eukprot:CAMPEP_0203816680 /NCGR_PEP_ID=MMETSP0115-20131106/17490_1 /ASSEMBLY_ACC=CAM_ASM_000227 /TAXON_ID=33651 /ORGANISM="Bicosoecid sp, Strain ms1" /LENGTH=75 /DNA_ID=CAMNT_0050725587 /DNA_START=398 /DNA_END=622 /DNA_ORIENTATION=+